MISLGFQRASLALLAEGSDMKIQGDLIGLEATITNHALDPASSNLLKPLDVRTSVVVQRDPESNDVTGLSLGVSLPQPIVFMLNIRDLIVATNMGYSLFERVKASKIWVVLSQPRKYRSPAVSSLFLL
jgi:hypothetical protein